LAARPGDSTNGEASALRTWRSDFVRNSLAFAEESKATAADAAQEAAAAAERKSVRFGDASILQK
jgi:hypothetical protein